MSSITIITIATFVIVAFICVRYALNVSRILNAHDRETKCRERVVTHYNGPIYNRHGRECN